MKCVFFGSPEFAVYSLRALLSSSHEVLAVITQPDKPAGRGLHLEAPPVKKIALESGIKIFQPEKLNTPETIEILESLQPDILVVVAYGKFLGEKLLTFCSLPPINVHPSLLPDLRGAAPMQWALVRGYKKSGITTQFMTKEMDAGDILLQVEEPIFENDTAKDLHDRWGVRGADLLVETLSLLEKKAITPRVQQGTITYAPLIEKGLGHIVWQKQSAETIHNLARGLFPWPGAFTYWQNKRMKILKTKRTDIVAKYAGRLWHLDDRIFVDCVDFALEILELQPEGKRALLPREFLNGMKNTEELFFDGA